MNFRTSLSKLLLRAMRVSHMTLNPVLMLLALSALPVAAASGAGAEVYKWIDERGVVNYSNTLPPKSTARDVAVVENRLSTYTPDNDVIAAVQVARELRRSAGSRGLSRGESGIERGTRSNVAVLGLDLPAKYDPCAGRTDVSCEYYFPYDPSPAFVGRQRVAVFFQPQLPPGAIAGHIAGPDGVIPGLSAQAQAFAPAGALRAPRASFTLKDVRTGRMHRSRR